MPQHVRFTSGSPMPGNGCSAASIRRPSRRTVWAITLFPTGFDQVIPRVLALSLILLAARVPRGDDTPGAFVRAVARPVHEYLVAVVDEPVQE